MPVTNILIVLGLVLLCLEEANAKCTCEDTKIIIWTGWTKCTLTCGPEKRKRLGSCYIGYCLEFKDCNHPPCPEKTPSATPKLLTSFPTSTTDKGSTTREETTTIQITSTTTFPTTTTTQAITAKLATTTLPSTTSTATTTTSPTTTLPTKTSAKATTRLSPSTKPTSRLSTTTLPTTTSTKATTKSLTLITLPNTTTTIATTTILPPKTPPTESTYKRTTTSVHKTVSPKTTTMVVPKRSRITTIPTSTKFSTAYSKSTTFWTSSKINSSFFKTEENDQTSTSSLKTTRFTVPKQLFTESTTDFTSSDLTESVPKELTTIEYGVKVDKTHVELSHANEPTEAEESGISGWTILMFASPIAFIALAITIALTINMKKTKRKDYPVEKRRRSSVAQENLPPTNEVSMDTVKAVLTKLDEDLKSES